MKEHGHAALLPGFEIMLEHIVCQRIAQDGRRGTGKAFFLPPCRVHGRIVSAGRKAADRDTVGVDKPLVAVRAQKLHGGSDVVQGCRVQIPLPDSDGL